MGERFVRKAISVDLSLQIDEMIKKIQEAFNLPLSKIQASKVVAWKAKSYNAVLTEKKLIEILGGKGGI